MTDRHVPYSMHRKGEELIMQGYVHVVELEGDRARTFGRLHNNGRMLPDELEVYGEKVRITVIDGELRGAGLYIFCKHEATYLRILSDCIGTPVWHSGEPDLINPHYRYEYP